MNQLRSSRCEMIQRGWDRCSGTTTAGGATLVELMIELSTLYSQGFTRACAHFRSVSGASIVKLEPLD